MTKKGRKTELKKGTELCAYETDVVSYIIFRDRDGNIWRMNLETNNDDTRFNGIRQKKLFGISAVYD